MIIRTRKKTSLKPVLPDVCKCCRKILKTPSLGNVCNKCRK
jgi:hypothetical protein